MSKQYDEYLENHISNVILSYDALCSLGILSYDSAVKLHLKTHDASKRGIEEYPIYDEYFYGYPEGERPEEVEHEFLYAFLHHLHHNPHHWQYWVLVQDVNEEHEEEVLEMPSMYRIEMVCDWMSFSMSKYRESGNFEDLCEVVDWYNNGKNQIKLAPETREFVEQVLGQLVQAIRDE